jgi:hypothetical protein
VGRGGGGWGGGRGGGATVGEDGREGEEKGGGDSLSLLFLSFLSVFLHLAIPPSPLSSTTTTQLNAGERFPFLIGRQ